MPTFELTQDEAQQLMNRLINSDPLLMKIAAQLREQQAPLPQGPAENIALKRNADGKDAGHGGLS